MRLKTPICQTYERSTVAFRKLRKQTQAGRAAKDSFQYELYLLGPALLLGLICTEDGAI